MSKKFIIDSDQEWNFSDIQKSFELIEKCAKKLKLDYYRPSIEIITYEQMLDAYVTIGLPIMYKHWSFGKSFIQNEYSYKIGQSGLALEMVLNTNSCINYLMEDNSLLAQAMVLSHAAIGHSCFFKTNYLFKQWTDPENIISYLSFAKDYIEEQEFKYGLDEVENWLDSCHALQNYGVNRYKKPQKLSLEKEKNQQKERIAFLETQVNELYLPLKKEDKKIQEKFPKESEENLLYFFEKYSPDIKEWQREILRIVRKISQYLNPQGMTKVTNEGMATITHYTIMTMLHEKKILTDGAFLEFLRLHSSVIYQPNYNSKYYRGFNPYKLGFEILQDVQRICENPTEEDKHWFPDLINQDKWEVVKDIVANYRDESFIRQFLSPKIIRDLRLFVMEDDRNSSDYVVKYIHNDNGYLNIREKLADNYLQENYIPQLEIKEVDKKTRGLTILYTPYKERKLDNINKLMPHLRKLWSGYSVRIIDKDNNIIS